MDPKSIPPLELLARTEEEVEEVERVFLSMTPVVDVTFLKEDFVCDCLSDGDAYDDEQYIEWNTSWKYSDAGKALSNYLIVNKVPVDTAILLKMY